MRVAADAFDVFPADAAAVLTNHIRNGRDDADGVGDDEGGAGDDACDDDTVRSADSVGEIV